MGGEGGGRGPRGGTAGGVPYACAGGGRGCPARFPCALSLRPFPSPLRPPTSPPLHPAPPKPTPAAPCKPQPFPYRTVQPPNPFPYCRLPPKPFPVAPCSPPKSPPLHPANPRPSAPSPASQQALPAAAPLSAPCSPADACPAAARIPAARSPAARSPAPRIPAARPAPRIPAARSPAPRSPAPRSPAARLAPRLAPRSPARPSPTAPCSPARRPAPLSPPRLSPYAPHTPTSPSPIAPCSPARPGPHSLLIPALGPALRAPHSPASPSPTPPWASPSLAGPSPPASPSLAAPFPPAFPSPVNPFPPTSSSLANPSLTSVSRVSCSQASPSSTAALPVSPNPASSFPTAPSTPCSRASPSPTVPPHASPSPASLSNTAALPASPSLATPSLTISLPTCCSRANPSPPAPPWVSPSRADPFPTAPLPASQRPPSSSPATSPPSPAEPSPVTPPSTSPSPASPSPPAPQKRWVTPSCIAPPRAPRNHRTPNLTVPSSPATAGAPCPPVCTSGGYPPHPKNLLPPEWVPKGLASPLPIQPVGGLMGEAPVTELDAVLGGGGWDVGVSFEGPPPPTGPIRLGRNACYVVLAVLFNEEDAVLLVQEAKPECRGRWYLPAGRMEPGESIVAAMRREVKEETGLECEPLTLLALEERGPGWIRFAFLARPTGGTLKTLEEADAESLQAAWWAGDPSALPLRAPDILPLLDLAARYRRSPPHPPTLPQELPCALICLRLLVAFANDAGDLWVLLGTAGTPHLPVVACGMSLAEFHGGLRLPVLQLLRDCLPPDPRPGPLGLLGLQHRAEGPGGADGVCFNMLLSIPPGSPGAAPPEPRTPTFCWWRVEEESLRERILQRLRAAATVPVRS